MLRFSRLLVLLSTLAALPAGCDRPHGEGSAKAANRRSQGALVEVTRVAPGTLSDHWTFLGNVRAGMRAELAAAAAGEVRWVGPREGDHVPKKAVLLRVDARVARAKVLAAKAKQRRAAETLAQAKREAQRRGRLSRQARSELELERALSAVRVAQAEVSLLAAETQQAVAELALHRVVAPFAGVITARRVDPGDWVSVGTRVLDLVSTEALEVLVDVPPRLLQFVRRGTKAAIYPSASEVALAASVSGVVQALDPVARTARLRLVPNQPQAARQGLLRAGAAVRVSFSVLRKGGVVVPRDALVVSPTAVRVVKVHDSKARHVVVDVLATANDRALVIAKKTADQRDDSLKPGDAIVVRGNERLRPGQLLRIAARSGAPQTTEKNNVTEDPPDSPAPEPAPREIPAQQGRSSQGWIAHAIDRPVTVLVGVLLLTLFGVLSLVGVPIQLTPDIVVPTLTVTTVWPGAAPTEIEAEVLKPQEEVLKNLTGLVTMTSEARTGEGEITLELRVGTPIEDALVRVSNRLSQVPSYPADVRKPVLSSADATGPPMIVAVIQSLSGKAMAPYRTWVEQEILPVLERQRGVGQVMLVGGQERQVEVLFSPHALAARRIPLSRVAEVIRGQLRDVSGGDIELGKRRMLVRTPLAPKRPEELEKLVLKVDPDGRTVYLGDVAKARYGLRKPDALAFSDGRPSLALLIFREPGSNVLAVTRRLRRAMSELDKTRIGPEGLEIRVVSDQVDYITGSLRLMQVNLAVGGGLAMLVLFLFLRSVRAAGLISLAIPICLVGTALGMALLGRTINIVSLAGVAFAVGMVVDNSIVVLEAIYTRYRAGEPARTAALEGTREVWGAILASTATTAVVFLPIIGWQDEVGELLRDVATALSVAVIVSLVVSVFVISAFARRVLSATAPRMTKDDAPSFGERVNRGLGFCASWVSRTPLRAALVVVLSFGAAAGAVWSLLPPLEYLPTGSRNLVFGIMVPAPGMSVEELARVGKDVQRDMMAHTRVERDGVPSIERSFYVARPERVFMGAVASNPEQLPGIERFVREVQGKVAGVYRIVVRASLFGRRFGGGRSIEIDISGENLAELIQSGRALMGSLPSDLPGVQLRPIPSLDLGAPELRVIPKREQLGQVGLSAADLALAVDALIDGAIVGEISQPGQPRLDVVLRAQDGHLRSPEALAAAPVATLGGQVVPVGTLARIDEALGPAVLRRLERRRTITLQTAPPVTIPLEQALQRVRDRVETLRRSGAIPRSVRIGFSGSAGSLESAKSRFGWVLLLAVVICLLLMAAIFEDFIAPLAILITLPFAAAGGAIALFLVDRLIGRQPLDMMTALGFLILIGVVVNNAILVVDGALHRLADGMALADAIGSAVERRVRPILMSTLTSLAGLMPLVVARGFGSELYRGVGAIVLGGLAVATLLTLFVVPAAFSLLWRLRRRSV